MTKPELKNIPIEYLKPGKYQTRCIFDQESLQELAESIRAEGLIQPIIVRLIDDKNDKQKEQGRSEKAKKYEIVAGERRWRAAQLANLDMVPCLVNNYTDEQVAAITPIENVQRENLNPIEEALAYRHLIAEFNYIHEEVAIAVGKSRPKITNLLRLLNLDVRVQKFIISGDLSEGHGKVIVGLPYDLQYKIAKESVDQEWSSRKLEQEVKRLHNSPNSVEVNNRKNDPDIRALEKLISNHVGSETKLEIDADKKNSGWLKIRYFNNEILTGILDKLGIKYDE